VGVMLEVLFIISRLSSFEVSRMLFSSICFIK